jgi:hypothetical protein
MLLGVIVVVRGVSEKGGRKRRRIGTRGDKETGYAPELSPAPGLSRAYSAPFGPLRPASAELNSRVLFGKKRIRQRFKGVARACKTSIPGSNPGGASKFFLTKTLKR